MKDVISVDSNSKSEEHRCEECNAVCQNCNTSPEPPQNTSLDMPTLLEAIEQGGTGIYRTSRLMITGDISELKELLVEQQANLLQVIEDEVNKCEIDDHTVQTIFKHEVLLALKKIKERYE